MIRKLETNYVETRMDDELVLVHIDRGSFHAMKTTGLAIWSLIDGVRDKDAIVADLTQRYAIAPEQCAAEVERFLQQVEAAGLIQRD